MAAGKTFTFTVKQESGNGEAKVTVKVGDTPANGWYTGSATIEVPFGDYTVTEDALRSDCPGLVKWRR